MPEKIRFFPLDISYKVIDNKPIIHLYGRIENGPQVCVLDDSFEPYFYAVAKEGAEMREELEKLSVTQNNEISYVTRSEPVSKEYLGKKINAVKIFTKLPRDVPVIREIVKGWETIDSMYEYDIPFVRKYLIDRSIVPMTLYEAEGDYVSQKSRVPVFSSVKIEPAAGTYQNPKIVAFDIETYSTEDRIDFDTNPILMLALYSENYKKVFVWKKFPTEYDFIEFVGSEAELLEKFRQALSQLSPDLLVGYYSDSFDLAYIKRRTEINKINLDIGLDHSEIKLGKGMNESASIIGISHIDMYKFVRKIMPGMDSYSLGNISLRMLGQKKHEVNLDELPKAWDANIGLEKFASYNLQDTLLTFNLADKMLPTMIEMVKIIGLPIFDIARMGFSQLVEYYIFKQAPSFNEIAPNKPSSNEVMKRRMQTYGGAFVFEPKPGLYKDITVFDYRSLYPTIIASHNICPTTLTSIPEEARRIDIDSKESFYFSNRIKGFIPTLIEDIITRRTRIKEIIKEQKDEKFEFMDARQNTLKLLANSFYGYLGFFNARWYSVECAKSVTALGRHYIHDVISKAGQKGFAVLYSDTDSVFLSVEGKSEDDARHFVESINAELPGLMELEYEGFYPYGIFVSAKIGSFGAKKKYALVRKDGSLKIRGFESVRRNWSLIAKNVQEKVLDIILRERDPGKAVRYVKEIIKDLKEKKIPIAEVIIHTQLQKNIMDYAARGPHVAVAERLKGMGRRISPGIVIKYVVTQGSDIIRNRSKLPEEVKEKDYDADYYIHNQVVPAVERILSVCGYTKEELTESHKQKKLEGFFN